MTFTQELIEEWREEVKADSKVGAIFTKDAEKILLALDEIERLQKRVEEVEDNREHIEILLCKAEKHIAELEAQQRWLSVDDPAIFELDRGFYLYEDRRGAHNIGLFTFEDRRLLGATRIYNMRLYPPHLRNIPNPRRTVNDE